MTTDIANLCPAKIKSLAAKAQVKFPVAKIAVLGITARKDVIEQCEI